MTPRSFDSPASFAPIFASEELLDHTAEEVGEVEEEKYDPEDLKEYLRRMNPEDFGRFTL